MGPTILLDKSVIQSLSQRAIIELGRYFTINAPPVLLLEMLADLSLDPDDLKGSAGRVRSISRKALPPSAFVNVDYFQLCVLNLLGQEIPMPRRPIIGGAQRVESVDGQVGSYIGVQPENEAVLRWGSGIFSEADVAFAKNWRNAVEAIDLDQVTRQAPKSPVRLRSLDQLVACVDEYLGHHESQLFLVNWFMKVLRVDPAIQRQVLERWNNLEQPRIQTFAPYAAYCVRVRALFDMGISHHLLSTRSSNLVDITYLYYSPCCKIFSTGDKFLKQFASITLLPDVSLVDGEELRMALEDVAGRREVAMQAVGQSGMIPVVEPDEQSVIQRLWRKHTGGFRPQSPSRPITPERSAQINAELKPIFDAVDEASRKRPPNPLWPH